MATKAVNIWAARFIPLIIMVTVCYATYVLVGRLCVDYLLLGSERRAGTVIAILAIYFLLLLPMAISYFRIVYIVTADPGFVPRGPPEEQGPEKRQRRIGARNDLSANSIGREYEAPNTEVNWYTDADSPGLEEFYTKDVFVCEQDGRPKWCTKCRNWKPDRAHHSSDVGHCVRKMDHFCPWVGGVVAENSFKFFIQFVAYGTIYCAFSLIVMAYYVHEQISTTEQLLDPQFTALLVLAAFFGLFSFGMTCSSVHFTLANLTTIENLNKKTKAWQLAVFLPNPEMAATMGPSGTPYPTITYPLPLAPEKCTPASAQSNSTNGEASQSGDRHISPNRQSERDSKAKRTFAILRMEPGRSPWDLGPLRNWKTVMGNNVLDWFLPISRSPCCNHESSVSQYALGANFERLLADHGLQSENETGSPRSFPSRVRTSHSRRKSRDIKMQKYNQPPQEQRRSHRSSGV